MLHQRSLFIRHALLQHFLLTICFVSFCVCSLSAQSITELEDLLGKTIEKREQWEIVFDLSKKCLADAPEKAATYAKRAVQLALDLKNKELEARSAALCAELAWHKGKGGEAIAYYSQAYDGAVAHGLPELSMQVVDKLLEVTVKTGDYKAAYQWSTRRSELLEAKSRRYAEEQRQKHETAQTALTKQKNLERRNLLAGLVALSFLMAYLYFSRQRANRRTQGELAEKNAVIEEKRRRGEHLLLNILPKAVAAELTVRNKVAARRYEKATVMFIDFVGFTQSAELLDPEVLVAELDYCFSCFDRIIGNYRLEKIKTVGDAYICASGLSDHNEQPFDMIRAALDIQAFLQKFKSTRTEEGRTYLEARIGIHFGPVVAGVVGTKKFAYDIWGDTVNTAARMEESCEPNRVNVSGVAQAIARDVFQWEYRGKIAAKNKLEMEMWYVSNIPPSLAPQ